MLPTLNITTDDKDNKKIQTLKSLLDQGIDDLEAGRTIPADEAIANLRKEMLGEKR